MHHGLVMVSELIWVSLEVKHEHFYHVSVSSRCCQMNCLRAHMRVSVLCHRSLRYLIVSELVPHRVQNQTGLLKTYELKHVHIGVEAQVQVFFLGEA